MYRQYLEIAGWKVKIEKLIEKQNFLNCIWTADVIVLYDMLAGQLYYFVLMMDRESPLFIRTIIALSLGVYCKILFGRTMSDHKRRVEAGVMSEMQHVECFVLLL